MKCPGIGLAKMIKYLVFFTMYLERKKHISTINRLIFSGENWNWLTESRKHFVLLNASFLLPPFKSHPIIFDDTMLPHFYILLSPFLHYLLLLSSIDTLGLASGCSSARQEIIKYNFSIKEYNWYNKN